MFRNGWYLVLAIGWMSNARAQGSYHMMRYEDNYEYLKDSSNRSWYDKLKYSPLGKQSAHYLSIGGEVRYQYFRISNEEWGDAPRDNDGFVLARYLVHVDIHYNPSVRLFAQLQSSLSNGRVEEAPPGEQNELDLHQAFVDVTLIRRPSSTIYFRIGRQEMSYGASRLVSVREGPNTRQAFDGAKLLFVSADVRADVFYTDYVVGREGILNDRPWNNDTHFWGTYWTVDKIPRIQKLDLYYLGIQKKNAHWNDLEGKEMRHSVGARISGKRDRLTYDFEGVYQFGDMASTKIEAWTLSSHTMYTLGNREESTTLALKTELISGDLRTNDEKIQSFNPLFPRGAYFGYAALIGPSNLFDLHPSWTIPLSTSFEADIDYDIFWRYTSADGIYNQDASLMYPAGDRQEKFIGHQISGNIEFIGHDHVFVRTEVTWFHAGDYLNAVSAGKDIFFVGITTRFRF
jgi:hypothetical protein